MEDYSEYKVEVSFRENRCTFEAGWNTSVDLFDKMKFLLSPMGTKPGILFLMPMGKKPPLKEKWAQGNTVRMMAM